MWPWTTGSAASPRYAALAVIPGNREISVIGRMGAMPGNVPGTFTNASLALLAVR